MEETSKDLVVVIDDAAMSIGDSEEDGSESDGFSRTDSNSSRGNFTQGQNSRKRPADESPEREWDETRRREFPITVTRSEGGCRVHIPTSIRAGTLEVVAQMITPTTSTTNTTSATDTTGVPIATDATGVPLATNATGVPLATDTTGVPLATHATGVPLATDTTGVLLATDPTGVLPATDPTGVLLATDTTGVLLTTDTTGATKMVGGMIATGATYAPSAPGASTINIVTCYEKAMSGVNATSVMEVLGDEVYATSIEYEEIVMMSEPILTLTDDASSNLVVPTLPVQEEMERDRKPESGCAESFHIKEPNEMIPSTSASQPNIVRGSISSVSTNTVTEPVVSVRVNVGIPLAAEGWARDAQVVEGIPYHGGDGTSLGYHRGFGSSNGTVFHCRLGNTAADHYDGNADAATMRSAGLRRVTRHYASS